MSARKTIKIFFSINYVKFVPCDEQLVLTTANLEWTLRTILSTTIPFNSEKSSLNLHVLFISNLVATSVSNIRLKLAKN